MSLGTFFGPFTSEWIGQNVLNLKNLKIPWNSVRTTKDQDQFKRQQETKYQEMMNNLGLFHMFIYMCSMCTVYVNRAEENNEEDRVR